MHARRDSTNILLVIIGLGVAILLFIVVHHLLLPRFGATTTNELVSTIEAAELRYY